MKGSKCPKILKNQLPRSFSKIHVLLPRCFHKIIAQCFQKLFSKILESFKPLLLFLLFFAAHSKSLMPQIEVFISIHGLHFFPNKFL